MRYKIVLKHKRYFNNYYFYLIIYLFFRLRALDGVNKTTGSDVWGV